VSWQKSLEAERRTGHEDCDLQAKSIKARLDSWGEFRCPNTGGWTPVDNITLAADESNYWCSLGVAAQLRDAISRFQAFADTGLRGFTTHHLEKARKYVR
jgi:hypothetical protein